MLLSNPDAINEATTIRAAVAGQEEAFAELFNHHYPMIYAFAYRLCLDRASAQDLAQETFIKAARSLGGYSPRAPFRNWLYRICVNSVRDWQRSESRRRRRELVAQEMAMTEAEERMTDFETAHRALAALPGELRAAVVSVYFEGLSHAETGRILGCAEATVSWRILTAKRKLKSLLTHHG